MGRPRRSKEIKIQETILSLFPADGQQIRWTGLLTQAKQKKLSQSTLSIYLKKFQKDDWVKREVDGDAHPPKVLYRLTEAGMAALSRSPIMKMIQESGAIAQARYEPIAHVETTENTVFAPKLYFGSPPKDAVAEVTLIVDRKHAAEAERILLKMPWPKLINSFVESAKAVTYNLEAEGREPSTPREKIEWQHRAWNIDLAALIRFDGKNYCKQINWNERIRNAETKPIRKE